MSIPQCVIRLRHVGEHLGCTAGCYALLPFCPSNEKLKLRFPNFPQRCKDCEDVCKYCNLKCELVADLQVTNKSATSQQLVGSSYSRSTFGKDAPLKLPTGRQLGGREN